MAVPVVPFFREIVEILAIERENAAQTGTMEQTESSDWMIWIFQGKSGKQTDSRSSVLIIPVKPFRRLSRLFRCSRFLLRAWRSIARAAARLNHLPAERPLARGAVIMSQLSMIAERAGRSRPFKRLVQYRARKQAAELLVSRLLTRAVLYRCLNYL